MYGLLPGYETAKLSKLDLRASPDLKALKDKILTLSRDDFFKKKINLYLFGRNRRGKTWMFHAIAHHFINTFNEKSIHFIEAPRLYEFFTNRKKHPRFDCTWISFLAQKRVLILDDLGQEYRSGSGFAESNIEKFLRWRFNHNRITFVGSNANFEEIENVYGQSFRLFLESEFIGYEVSKGKNMSVVKKVERIKSAEDNS